MTDVEVDVAIVGGRCSGAPLATFLARRGVRVCIVDKARFPSDTASTHIIQPRGVAVLDRLGVLDELHHRGAATLDRLTLVYGDARLEGDYGSPLARTMLSTGSTPGLNARRTILDDVLLSAAREAGAEVRTLTPVETLLRDRTGRVNGVRTPGGAVRAAIVVGADGRSSRVAQQVGAAEYATYPAGRFAAWAYYEGAASDANRLRIGRLGEDAWISCPSDNGSFLVGAVPSTEGRDRFLADRDCSFTTYVQRWPELAALVEGATRVGPLRVVADWHGYFRESAGPGWVLTGDAGNFKDPSAAQGITDALRQAETLADAIACGLDTGGDLDLRTQDFWRWRDRDCAAMHWFASDIGAAGPTLPVTEQTVRDVAGDEVSAIQLMQVLNRDLSPKLLITRRRQVTAVARALRRPGRRAVLHEVSKALTAEVRRARAVRPRR